MHKFSSYILISLLICVSWTLRLPAYDVPAKAGPVNDLAAVLSVTSENSLERLSVLLLEATGEKKFSLVYLTVRELPEEVIIEDYSNRVYEKWGIGAKGHDHGALLVVAVNNRKVRIETGYGSEGYLPDAVCRRIIEEMLPHFRLGDYEAGVITAAGEISTRVIEEFNIDPAILNSAFSNKNAGMKDLRKAEDVSIFQVIVFLLVAGFLIFTKIGRRILFLMIISGLFGGGRSHGGGGFGGGFSGGGGFGGGLSGGGGAGGSW